MKVKRKVTRVEREEVVTYALQHGKNYQATAEKFDVSYQQVYNWVRKFEKDGTNGLVDRRGQRKKQPKPTRELPEIERLKLENKRLKQEKLELEAGNFILKKLGALREQSRPQSIAFAIKQLKKRGLFFQGSPLHNFAPSQKFH